ALILGDMNLSCSYASADELAALDTRTDTAFQWAIPDSADTNVADSQCAYDRILARGDVLAGVGQGTVGAAEVQHSDHKPIGLEALGIRFGAYNLEKYGDTKAADAAAVAEIVQIVCGYD